MSAPPLHAPVKLKLCGLGGRQRYKALATIGNNRGTDRQRHPFAEKRNQYPLSRINAGRDKLGTWRCGSNASRLNQYFKRPEFAVGQRCLLQNRLDDAGVE